tara:strand:- start:6705 stop:6923 length:219 start_codon:yes stop_codon:yes gene_type:complete
MTNSGSSVIDNIFEWLDIKNRISNNLVYNFGEEWSIDKILEKIKIAVWLYLYYNILVYIWYIIAYSARNILD